MPYSPTNDLSPAERRLEIAAILGRGLHRFCAACKVSPETRDSAPDAAAHKALDVSAPGDPHVSWLTRPRT